MNTQEHLEGGMMRFYAQKKLYRDKPKFFHVLAITLKIFGIAGSKNR